MYYHLCSQLPIHILRITNYFNIAFDRERHTIGNLVCKNNLDGLKYLVWLGVNIRSTSDYADAVLPKMVSWR